MINNYKSNNMVQVYRSYIWTIVNNAVLGHKSIIDKDDLFQSGALALVNAMQKTLEPSYLKTAVRNAIHKQANRFHGCFTLNNHVIKEASRCRKEPLFYEKNSPIYRLTFHRVEELV